MKTYHVKVAFTELEIYSVQAEDPQDAENRSAEGKLIHRVDEELVSNVLSVEEVKP